MFQVGRDLERQKCGGCNWEVAKVYLMAESQEAADREYEESGAEDGEPRGLCGECMCEMLAEGNYTIDNEPNECPKCGKKFEVVSLGSDYKIEGCPEHREFDRTHKL